ncbi:MAG: hypothetical protein A2139_11125 [Desulfobacca sp. RBG_16_60_12]|nr:MAG: hypothetical protein A2139_11125 [Desulfobacca sp. RBG_16_60_12]
MIIEKHPKYWWQYKAWPDIVRQAKTNDIAILPLGSIEWHGPHLPTGHDTIQLFPMLEMIAERTGAMLLPCPWYGAHPCHHYGVPGTIPIRNETMVNLVKDIVHGASVAGYNKFILFYGHGQIAMADFAVQELGLEGYFVASVMFQNLTKDVQFKIMEKGFWRADESETSIGLYTHPEFVDMSKAAKQDPEPMLIDSKFVQGVSEASTSKPLAWFDLTVLRPESQMVAEGASGVFGDPTIATREKGEKYVQVIVDRMVELVDHIKEKYPAGVKPFTLK